MAIWRKAKKGANSAEKISTQDIKAYDAVFSKTDSALRKLYDKAVICQRNMQMHSREINEHENNADAWEQEVKNCVRNGDMQDAGIMRQAVQECRNRAKLAHVSYNNAKHSYTMIQQKISSLEDELSNQEYDISADNAQAICDDNIQCNENDQEFQNLSQELNDYVEVDDVRDNDNLSSPSNIISQNVQDIGEHGR